MDIALVAIASLSPLLTLAKLWQVKEWRLDRLLEHLRAEGWLQLIGKTRLTLLGILGIVGVVGIPLETITLLGLGVLSALTLIQIVLRRQPKPVWTKKAICIVGTGLLLTLLTSYIVHSPSYIKLLLPYLQFPLLALSLVVWKPIDKYLKKRLMNHARVVRDKLIDPIVIGVTGSVGKTTTKILLEHILQDKNPFTTPEHVNTEMGVSQWLVNTCTNQGVPGKILVIEMGAYKRGEIELLCSIAKPTIGAITYVGTQHIALFGSQENVALGKGELIESLPPNGQGFLNADCELCKNIKSRSPCPVTLVSTGESSDIQALDIEETPTGFAFTESGTRFSVPISGLHNVTNVLIAIGIARYVGMKDGDIAQKLLTFSLPDRTFSVRQQQGITILDATHNASAESMRAALQWAKIHPAQHKVLLSPGLIELGMHQDDIHTELGGYSAPIIDRAIFKDKNAAEHFAKGFGKPVDVLSKDTERIQENSLLLCVGRLPQSVIEQILPRT